METILATADVGLSACRLEIRSTCDPVAKVVVAVVPKRLLVNPVKVVAVLPVAETISPTYWSGPRTR